MHATSLRACQRQATARAPYDLVTQAGLAGLALARLNPTLAVAAVMRTAQTAGAVFALC